MGGRQNAAGIMRAAAGGPAGHIPGPISKTMIYDMIYFKPYIIHLKGTLDNLLFSSSNFFRHSESGRVIPNI